MRTALFAVAAALIFAASGCHHHNLARNGCSSCENGHAQRGPGLGLFANRGGCNCQHSHGQAGHGGGHVAHSGHTHGLGHGHGGPGVGGWGHGRQHQDHIPHLPRNQRHGRHEQGAAGPPSAAVGYPYYTTRGPRDFLMDNPPSIGP